MNALLLSLIGAAVTLAGIVAGWLGARRVASGNVSTSDAKTVFEEGRALRAEMRERERELHGRIQVMEERQVLDLRNVVRLETVVDQFKTAFEECKTELAAMRVQLDEAREHLAEVRAQLVVAKAS